MSNETREHLVLGISGASGMPYAQRLMRALLERTDLQLHLIFSPAAGDVLKRECDIALVRGEVEIADFLEATPDNPIPIEWEERVSQYPSRDIGARPASGSFLHKGMVVCPCAMKTVGALAMGYTDHLLTRAADVTLKERRKLVLVPRETPLALTHLRAMAAVAEAGGIILPAMPGFYHRPKTLEDILDFLVMKIFDALEISYESSHRWDPDAD